MTPDPIAATPPPDGAPSDPSAAAFVRPAFASLTLRGAVAMAIAYVAARFGLDVESDLASQLAARMLDLVFTLGVMAVSIGRARARGPLS